MPNNGTAIGNDASPAVAGGNGGGGSMKKGPWTAAEDSILMEYVKKHGEGNWNAVQKNSGLSRCGKSCRLRWANHLRPNLKKGSFSPNEERLILELHAKFGNKWARMAAQLPGRTDNEIKNYWNTRVKRRQRAGLPLYPHNIQKQEATFDLHHHHQQSHHSTCPPLPMQPPPSQEQQSNFGSPISLFDEINFTSRTPLLGHHNAPFLPTPIHRFKRLRDDNVGFSLPFLSAPLPPHSSGLFDQSLSTQLPLAPPSLQFNSEHFDFNPPPIMRTHYEPEGIVSPGSAFSMKMELPSSQLPQQVAAAAALGTNNNEYKMVAPLAQTNSGLLDALLQETQTMVGNEDSRRGGLLASEEENCGLEELVGDAPPFSSPNSSIRAKTEKEVTEEINSVEDDLCSLLDIVPSAMSAPEWYSDNGEISNGQQSSGMTDDGVGLEMQHLASSLSVTSTTDLDWTVGSSSCSWNNMPRIY